MLVPDELPEEPVLGVGLVGDLVVEPLDEPLPIEPDELPLEPLLPLVLEGLLVLPLEELEPDLLKWASHSEREI